MSGLAVLCLLLLQTGAHGFGFQFIFKGDSFLHEQITETAILNTTVHVCRDVAVAEGNDFTFPSQPFTAESVAAACGATKSSKNFQGVIKLIQKKNVRIDIYRVLSARHHFDDETFIEGRKIITDGLSAVKASNKLQNFEAATETLGFISHTLQDFYSHSNWIEMGNKRPNSNLIRPGTSIGNIADKSRATCRSCDGDDCRNNILEDILEEKVLTSGYFGLIPFFSTKPAGKCSHGGIFDGTKTVKPTGGINKDTFSSEHGHLHAEAAKVAIAATSELLEDIRGAAGDRTFLQMMGITRGKPLCFVIDTTGSIEDEIDAVRRVTSSIINSKVGTEDEPSLYILVPFSDPDFGPVTKTTDPEEFKSAIDSLSPSGGGDFPDMSLSALRLALTGAPPNSEIFLFTDAPAKDEKLKNTMIALIEETQTKVNFIMTNILGRRRRRDSDNNQQPRRRFSRMTRSDAQLYRDLAQASGGQVIEVTKSQLLQATSIITQSTSASLVTLLQAARSPGKTEIFVFTVDESVKNLTIYITGRSVSFTLISPSDVSQSSDDKTGPLIITSQSVGNFQTLQLKIQVGVWGMKMMSTNAYTLKVVGDSPIDFLFDFLKVSQGPFGGFEVLENRPRPGVNGTLRVTLTGSDSATVTEVSLVESLGSGKVNGSVEAQGEGDFIVRFDTIPSNEFVVVVKGQNSKSSSRSTTVPFQRQSSTSITASLLSVTADDSHSILVPGIPLSVPFSVETSGAGGTFTISATNDQGFTSTFPSTLYLETGGSANGTVNIIAPHDTPSGTEVTMTVEVNAPGGADTNYDVLLFVVLIPVTDFTHPVCKELSLQANCPKNCHSSTWEVSIQVTDEGTGVDRVSLRQGDGIMNTSIAVGNENITLVSYNASCCSPDMELTVVDRVGNVWICAYSTGAKLQPPMLQLLWCLCLAKLFNLFFFPFAPGF